MELTGPLAPFSATPTSGNAPLAVTFDASASMVPGGRTITAYNWDFDGNGTVDQTTATATTHAQVAGRQLDGEADGHRQQRHGVGPGDGGKPGSTYCFRLTATNGVGLTADGPDRCTALALHSYGLTVKGTWAKKSRAGHYLGRYGIAKARGASLSRTGVTVRRLAIVATRGRKGDGHGVGLYGTTRLKTIKLAARTTRERQVISVANFTKVRKGTVKIVVGSNGKPVIIEGLAVSKV